ncbi:nuclear body associated kinase [Culex quinquefasciatus]|uniref:Nuclear body associated kinase n=1 Tax=Culex quinquefasciatus TaxID=7176 RepID=B0WF05_CULQU|nr:nuclear body associated kinase [Culex quinquefasciatus]|eukprot:XP_001847289.1 nuclear body associated kinase [Culex quinquefasciatus]
MGLCSAGRPGRLPVLAAGLQTHDKCPFPLSTCSGLKDSCDRFRSRHALVVHVPESLLRFRSFRTVNGSRFQFQDECESPIWEVRRWVRKWDAGWRRKTELIRTSSAFTSFTSSRNQLVLVMTVSPLDQSKLKAPQSATNRGTPYTSSPEEMPTRLVASTKADGTKPSAHVVRPARVRHVHKQGMQGGLNDAPIKSPLASGKWDDEEQSEWTTSENQPSGKGTGLIMEHYVEYRRVWTSVKQHRSISKADAKLIEHGIRSNMSQVQVKTRFVGFSDLAEYLEPEDLNGAFINSIFLGMNILDESARDVDRMLSGVGELPWSWQTPTAARLDGDWNLLTERLSPWRNTSHAADVADRGAKNRRGWPVHRLCQVGTKGRFSDPTGDNPESIMCRSFDVAILSADVENREPQLWHVDPYERRQDHQVEQRGRAAAAREPFQKSVKKQKPGSLVHAESEPSGLYVNEPAKQEEQEPNLILLKVRVQYQRQLLGTLMTNSVPKATENIRITFNSQVLRIVRERGPTYDIHLYQTYRGRNVTDQ